MMVDLGEGRSLSPDHYCLRNQNHGKDHRLQHWNLEASNDSNTWTTLRDHVSDQSLGPAPMSTAAWPIEPANVQGSSFRYFRIQQTGPNSSGHHHLMCAGIELYGLGNGL